MTPKTATRRPSKPGHPRAERMTLHTLEEALADAARTFAPGDATCSLGDAYCPLADLLAWVAALSADQRILRRYTIFCGDITEHATGEVVSHYVPVVRIPPRAAVPRRGDDLTEHLNEGFLLAVQSLGFLQGATRRDTMRRARPVALGDNGMKFEDV